MEGVGTWMAASVPSDEVAVRMSPTLVFIFCVEFLGSVPVRNFVGKNQTKALSKRWALDFELKRRIARAVKLTGRRRRAESGGSAVQPAGRQVKMC